jgi:alpha-glucoside transport system substrate-binding protein
MRKRAKVGLLAAAALFGGAIAAGTATATTEPPGTEPMGTEAAGEEGGPGAGTGSGADSGIEGADLEGTTVTVIGPENSEAEAGAMIAALTEFGEANGIDIQYTGARDFEEQINLAVEGGNPPDIAIFPQPGKLAGFARSGDVLALPDDVLASVSANWAPTWMSFGNVDGTQYGVPNKSDLKSLVWYVPSAFAEAGYEVPTTLDDFYALVDTMIADGYTPLCVGVESGPATGWPFTDWVEELVLRNQGIDFYNQWVLHEVPFNSPEIVENMQTVADLWATEGAVYSAGGSITSTPFSDNAAPLVDGDCMMHRQASFFASFFPEGTEYGEGEGQVSTFYFPSNGPEQPVLVAGTVPGAFRDAPEVWAVMQYYGSPEYANARQAAQTELAGGTGASGFLSANLNADQSLYSPLEQQFIEVLVTGSPAGFDASDQMPGEVGSGSFWSEATSLINGEVDAQEAADAIEDSWP